jgi:hypothetical protein
VRAFTLAYRVMIPSASDIQGELLSALRDECDQLLAIFTTIAKKAKAET